MRANLECRADAIGIASALDYLEGHYPDVSRSWPAALSIHERLTALHADGSRAGPNLRFDVRHGDKLVREWQAMKPFAEADALASVEELYGCSQEEFEAALSLSDDTISRNFRRPLWLIDFAYSVCSSTEETGPGEETPARHLTRLVAGSFVSYYRTLFDRQLCDSADDSSLGYVRDLRQALQRSLEDRLFAILLPALTAELELERAAGSLSGLTPEDRFRSFLQKAMNRTWRDSFYARKPMVIRQAATSTRLFAEAGVEFCRRLIDDMALLEASFEVERDDQPSAVVPAGDDHAGGRAVLLVEFVSGARIVYKPRPLGIAARFQEFLSVVNAWHPLGFKTIRVVDRGEYGWLEFVPAEPCSDARAAERFYRRQGGMIALLHSLAAVDFHSENMLAAGEHPVAIDLESLFHPVAAPADDLAAGDRALHFWVNSIAAISLQRLGLLPYRHFSRDGASGVDLSGLGGGDAGDFPVRHPMLVDEGKDTMRLVMSQGQMSRRSNRPVLNGVTLAPRDYVSQIRRGFVETMKMLIEHRDDLLAPNGAINAFAAERTRIILRPTAPYSMLVTSLRHRECSISGIALDFRLDRFLTTHRNWRYRTEICEAERLDLWRGDIPSFASDAGSRDLWTSEGRRLPSFFTASGYEIARKRLEQLRRTDIEALAWSIEVAIDCAAADRTRVLETCRRWPIHRATLKVGSSAASDDVERRAIQTALALGERLIRLRTEFDKGLTWLKVTDTDSRLSADYMGVGLYDGLSGIALTLAYLSSVTRQSRFSAIAADVIATVRNMIRAYSVSSLGIGAFAGLGGWLYTLTHLAALWNDPNLFDEAVGYIPYLRERVASDDVYDIVGGSAGLVPILLSLERARPGQGALVAAVDCGRHLVRSAQELTAGCGWTGTTEQPLAGFGHGACGVAYALTQLWEETRENDFLVLATEALRYEQSLFNPERRSWPDLRRAEADPQRWTIAGWCHGAPGIALARCRIASIVGGGDGWLSEEIAAGVETTVRSGFGRNHSLCHGDLGNREVLVEVSSLRGNAQHHATAQALDDMILNDLAAGYKTGITAGVDSPDLMRGISGLVLGLLRIARPATVPSVLLLDPPSFQRRAPILEDHITC